MSGKGKWKLLALLAAAALLTAAPAAMAAITNTSHDVTFTATSGQVSAACSVCHIPHGGAGARLWPVAPASEATKMVGAISTLCGTCHYSTGSMTASWAGASDSYVYGTNSHGVQMVIADIPGTSTLTNSDLPYTGASGQPPATDGKMECTSCHDPHNDGSKPFLRVSLEVLCQRCHGNRNFVGSGGADSSGAGATFGVWNDNQTRATNPGSHPIGTNIDNTFHPALAKIVWPAEATVKKQTGTTKDQWHLGGHLAGTDGASGAMGCNSCHAVHGIQADAGDGTFLIAALEPVSNMLIKAQSAGSSEGVTTRTIASGDGDAYNAVCEACHQGDKGSAYTTTFWNPGMTAYGHVVDAKPSVFGGAGAGDFPTNWPKASTTANGMDPICESCHSPHPAANTRGTLLASKGPFILRASGAALCNSCHASGTTIANHHPTKATGGVAGVTYLQSGGNLGCGTCHGGNSAVHNWPSATSAGSYPVRTEWRPANNARNDRFYGDGSTNPYASTSCMDCHLALRGSANPGLLEANSGEYQAASISGATREGTHYIGPFANGFFASRTLAQVSGTPAINVSTDNWVTSTGGAFAAFSRFGGTVSNPVLVCESCHNVAPSKNQGTKLTLFPYVEGADNNFIQAESDLCVGCHGIPAGTHPETGNTVGRTGGNLKTYASGSYTPAWLVAVTAGNGPTFGADRMSCDACHQPHSAPTQSGTLIIDTLAANVTSSLSDNAVTLTGVNSGNAVAHRRIKANNNLPAFSDFCAQCHGYK